MSEKRYLILAILGALIIGISSYLFLNNFLDKTEILVFSKDIKVGEIIREDDLYLKYFYKNSLPDNYLVDKTVAVGEEIFIERKKGDYISKDMLTKKVEDDPSYKLLEGEVLIAINFNASEPIINQIEKGKTVSIVSTSQNKTFSSENIYLDNPEEEIAQERTILSTNYIDSNSFKLSESILCVDGYFIIRDLEVLKIERKIDNGQNILTGVQDNEIFNLYLKCRIEEAPYISDLISNNNYKIIIEGSV